jgi:ABC-type xylose transport system substrate-binding protein
MKQETNLHSGSSRPAGLARSRKAAKIAMLIAATSFCLASTGAFAQDSTISASSFAADFSAMAQLKSLATSGKGKIGVLLPETTTSARYTSFDAPYLTKAFDAAGLASSDVIITNAQGSESTELTQAQSDISQGATVLIVDPISSGVGASIESYAKQHGVAVIDYDRLTLGGSRGYYVSFDNEKVGGLIGQGMVSCLSDWKVSKPAILVMRGAAVISYLKTLHVPPHSFPTTGQDATLTGLQNVLSGYQCGTVYKPIYLEAQGAAALALYVRAGQTPPATLVNGQTEDSQLKQQVPSVLMTPIWVTPANLNETAVKDKFVDASKLCAGNMTDACKAANISAS